MSAVRAAGTPPDVQFSDPQHSGHSGPTVSRMLLGAQLRRLREAAGVTREDAGYAIRASESKMSRLELGRISFKPRDVADLLTLYGVGDTAERAVLLAVVEQANAPGWWQPFKDVLPGWFEPYLGLEQAASLIRTYEVQFVPGLLQTDDYARAVIRLGHENASELEIERRVQVRAHRRGLLREPGGPKLWAVLDEAALRRPFGSAAILRAQLDHLIEMARLPQVTLQVIPFSAGGHAAAGGPITILRLPEGDLPDVVYLEQLTTAVYLDKPADTEHYWHVMNQLGIEAAVPGETTALLRGIREEI
ncbi:helix-turn-helix domain-containing protein [Actinomadura alba]|uniref:Helix-turn-helix domain-containing protein n=1 Tax=Actinomadura alba TaxID=406431 RepID=A0ABR7LXH5_9ACTN|nr:helix-turn-helix domain-containing protein [Actinomadura alba]